MGNEHESLEERKVKALESIAESLTSLVSSAEEIALSLIEGEEDE